MTQEKATARPWVVSETSINGHDWPCIRGDLQGDGGWVVALIDQMCVSRFDDEPGANAELIVTAVNERDALLSEVAQLRAETLKGICVYCGYIEQYESLGHKASKEGNAMRIAHIRQCEARPEAKLITYAEELQTVLRGARDALRSYEYGNVSPDLARAIADKADDVLAPPSREGKR